MRKALEDPNILGLAMPWETTAIGWKALLLACAGEQLTDVEREHFKRLTGREREPGDGVLCEAFLCVGGRRGGKSKSMAVFCAWLASCIDWSDHLSLGEHGRVMFVAPAME